MLFLFVRKIKVVLIILVKFIGKLMDFLLKKINNVFLIVLLGCKVLIVRSSRVFERYL